MQPLDINLNGGNCGYGNNCGYGGYGGLGAGAGLSAGLGGAAGALVGSLFGRGGFGGGWGNGCGGAPVAAAIGMENTILDSVGNVYNAVNAGTISAIEGRNDTNVAVLTGFNGVQQGQANQTYALSQAIHGIEQGQCNQTYALSQAINNVNVTSLLGQKDSQLQSAMSTNCITKAIEECCCKTNEHMDALAMKEVESKLCAANSKIAQLETLCAVDHKIEKSTAIILGHLHAQKAAAAAA